MFKKFAAAALIATLSTSASAGWFSDVERDPFTKSVNVMAADVQYFDQKDAILFMCGSTEDGVTIRVVPGYEHPASATLSHSAIAGGALAIDGEIVDFIFSDAWTGNLGDGRIYVDFQFDHAQSVFIANAFSKAKSNIVIKDGISTTHATATASGSTAAMVDVLACLNSQGQAS